MLISRFVSSFSCGGRSGKVVEVTLPLILQIDDFVLNLLVTY